MPVFGNLVRKIAIARFTRNFANMISGGVPILTALNVVGETSGNWVIAQATQRIAESVRTGQSITKPLASEPVNEARCEISIQLPSGSRTKEKRATSPSVTAGRPSRPPRSTIPACSWSQEKTWTVR